ncbi:hypothetical protein ScPMuIL_010838 [Solemya velum]
MEIKHYSTTWAIQNTPVHQHALKQKTEAAWKIQTYSHTWQSKHTVHLALQTIDGTMDIQNIQHTWQSKTHSAPQHSKQTRPMEIQTYAHNPNTQCTTTPNKRCTMEKPKTLQHTMEIQTKRHTAHHSTPNTRCTMAIQTYSAPWQSKHTDWVPARTGFCAGGCLSGKPTTGPRSISRVSKTGRGRTVIGPPAFPHPNGIAFHQNGFGFQGSNACTNSNGGCAQLCFPHPGGKTCGCADGLSLFPDGISCGHLMPCPTLSNPTHGQIFPTACTAATSTSGTTCKISCASGFRLEGPQNLTCQARGMWSNSEIPICRDVQPPILHCPTNMVVTAPSGAQVMSVTWTSPNPTDNSGNVTLVASRQSGSQFNKGTTMVLYQAFDPSGLTSVCSFNITVNVIQCTQLHAPANGFFTTPCSRYLGASCHMACNNNYMPSGHPLVTCQLDGNKQAHWSGNVITCAPAACPALTPPAHGSVSPQSCTAGTSSPNAACRVSCSSGFRVQGATTITCNSNGQWNNGGASLTCLDNRAPTLNCPPDQSVTAPMGSVTAQVSWPAPTAHDNAGGSVTITQSKTSPQVLAAGTYNIQVTATDTAKLTTQCTFTITVTVLVCAELHPPPNGFIAALPCPQNYGASCRLACNPGFKLSGSPIVTCVVDSHNRPQWNSSGISCRENPCPSLYNPTHGSISPASCTAGTVSVNTKCMVSCDHGYELLGAQSVTCLQTGTWSDSVPHGVCRDNAPPNITCPGDISVTAPKGSLTATVNWTAPTITDNSLNFQLQQSEHPPKTWGEGEHPVYARGYDSFGLSSFCSFTVRVTVLQCVSYQAPQNGHIINPASCQRYYGAKCQVACAKGFKLSTNPTVTCDKDNKAHMMWTNGNVTCTARSTTAAPPSNPTQRQTNPDKPSNTGAIIGGVIGSVALLALIVLGIMFYRKGQSQGGGISRILGRSNRGGMSNPLYDDGVAYSAK